MIGRATISGLNPLSVSSVWLSFKWKHGREGFVDQFGSNAVIVRCTKE